MKLTNALRSITIVAAAAASVTAPSYSASFIDTTDSGRQLPSDSVGAMNGVTAISIVPAMPAGSISREVESMTVYNRDTTSHTITVSKVDNGTSYPIFKATIGAGESIHYDGSKWSVMTVAGEIKASTLGSQSSTAGTKNGSTVSVSETSFGPLHQTVLTCTATPITISDDAGQAQYGGVKVYTFPEGLISTVGAVASGALTAGVTGTIIDNWDGNFALGTVTATTGATLVSTEADILPSADVSAGAADKIGVVAAVSAAAALTESGARWLDGTATAVPVFANFLIDDDATHTAGTATFTGTITLTWMNLGDK
jgi:hypothetical protein